MKGSEVKRASGPLSSGAQDDAHVQIQDYLAFLVGGERYAFPILSVRELMRVPVVTEIPRGPRCVLGIISVRGHVTTLLDVRCMLGMPAVSILEDERVLLVRHEGETFGFLVDKVLQVYRLTSEDIEPASMLSHENAPHVTGIARPREEHMAHESHSSLIDGTQILILLDPHLLLASFGWM